MGAREDNRIPLSVPLIPRYAFGNWWSRYHEYSDKEYLHILDKFERRDVPLDELVKEALKTQSEPYYYSADGVHLNPNGAELIGKIYAEAVKPLIEATAK